MELVVELVSLTEFTSHIASLEHFQAIESPPTQNPRYPARTSSDAPLPASDDTRAEVLVLLCVGSTAPDGVGPAYDSDAR